MKQESKLVNLKGAETNIVILADYNYHMPTQFVYIYARKATTDPSAHRVHMT